MSQINGVRPNPQPSQPFVARESRRRPCSVGYQRGNRQRAKCRENSFPRLSSSQGAQCRQSQDAKHSPRNLISAEYAQVVVGSALMHEEREQTSNQYITV